MTTLRNAVYATVAISLTGVGILYAQSKPAPALTPEKYAASTEWPTFGHDAGGMRFSPLKEITPANVGSLEVAWTYHLKPDGYVAPAGGRGGGRPGGGPPAGAPPAGAPPAGAPPAADAGGRGGGRGAATGFRGSEATPLI